jgi:hypothetical protein
VLRLVVTVGAASRHDDLVGPIGDNWWEGSSPSGTRSEVIGCSVVPRPPNPVLVPRLAQCIIESTGPMVPAQYTTPYRHGQGAALPSPNHEPRRIHLDPQLAVRGLRHDSFWGAARHSPLVSSGSPPGRAASGRVVR